MPDLRTQFRAHYEAQSLSSEKVAEILARCQEETWHGFATRPPQRAATWKERIRDEMAAVGDACSHLARRVANPSHVWQPLAVAAALVLFAGSAWLWTQRAVPYPALQTRLVDFFAGKYDIPKVSQDQTELRAWLIAKGAPAGFEVPERLRPMQAYGCRVLDVRHKEAFLMCFWLPTNPETEKRKLLHLLVSERADFRGGPSSAQPQFSAQGPWSFAAWSEGEVVYTLGSMVPPERLQLYVARAQQRGAGLQPARPSIARLSRLSRTGYKPVPHSRSLPQPSKYSPSRSRAFTGFSRM